jgi:hypothetical protein
MNLHANEGLFVMLKKQYTSFKKIVHAEKLDKH